VLEDLLPPEAEKLKKRFDSWREAMDRLKASVPREEVEPLFASELEKPL
jgi:hypothetical protein